MTRASLLLTALPVLAGLIILGACSSSDNGPAGSEDSGTGGKAATGGSKSSSGGKSGAGGASGATSSGGKGGASGAAGATMCTVAVATACDGPEDCSTGQRCCGKYQQGYVEFGCFDSCSALQGDAQPGPGGGGAFWFELCHPGDVCEDTTAQCLTSTFLPKTLSRCLPSMLMMAAMGGPPDASLGKGKSQINCGAAVCGSSEECCLRQPLAPYCAAKGQACDCNVSDAGGAPDAGGGARKDASADVTTPSVDAAADGP